MRGYRVYYSREPHRRRAAPRRVLDFPISAATRRQSAGGRAHRICAAAARCRRFDGVELLGTNAARREERNASFLLICVLV